MSCLSSFLEVSKTPRVSSFRKSVTLLTQVSVADDGRFSKKSSFTEFVFAEQPYSTISIDEFSINAISASGGNPSQTFISSNDVDEVIRSVDNLRKTLKPKSNA